MAFFVVRLERQQVGGASISRTGNASMKANPARFAAGLALAALSAPVPAFGQYFPPPLIIVPPPAQEYVTPRPGLKSQQPAKPKPPDSARPQTKSGGGHYEGRTYVPD
jgi:hypothetical protein